MKTIKLTIYLTSLLSSCNTVSPDFSIFVGTWENKQSSTIEQWKKENNNLLTAKAFFIEINDTTMLERLSLTQTEEGYFYVAQVLDQNKGEDVFFKLTKFSLNHFVFENPNHDYPQRITYRFEESGNSLSVWIEKLDKHEPNRKEFCFKRRE